MDMNDKETREERLAAALRENLRRRKARARGEADADAAFEASGSQSVPTSLDTNGGVD
jgi:hypothetical protein